MTFEEVLRKVNANIADVEGERMLWEERLELAQARVDCCQRALAECNGALAMFTAIREELIKEVKH